MAKKGTVIMKSVSTYSEMAEVVSRPYIDYKGIMVLAPIGSKAAQKMIKNIQTAMIDKGEPIISEKPRLVPTEYVLSEIGITAKQIIKKAKETKL